MRARTSLACAVVLLLGCGSPADTDPRVLTGTLTIDARFSVDQRQSVLDAIDVWRDATGERFDPSVRIGEVSCGQPFALAAVSSEGCHVGQTLDEGDSTGPIEKVLGAADPERHSISVVTWLQGPDFGHNVEHELGHYLLLGHGQGIMAQSRDHQPAVVAAASISEFCAIWTCDARGIRSAAK